MIIREVDLSSPYDLSEIASYASALLMVQMLGEKHAEELRLDSLERRDAPLTDKLVRCDFIRHVLNSQLQTYLERYESYDTTNYDYANLDSLKLYNPFALYASSYSDQYGIKLTELRESGFAAYVPKIQQLASFSFAVYGSRLSKELDNFPDIFLNARYESAVWMNENNHIQTTYPVVYLPGDKAETARPLAAS